MSGLLMLSAAVWCSFTCHSSRWVHWTPAAGRFTASRGRRQLDTSRGPAANIAICESNERKMMMTDQRPSGARTMFSVGALMLLVPVVLVLGALFVALLYEIAGLVGLVVIAGIAVWLVMLYRRRGRGVR